MRIGANNCEIEVVCIRIKHTLLNFFTGIVTRLITIILQFLSRTVFIHTLGIAYLGVNGLMTNVMSMLSIAELGIGAAITYSLYKPLAENDTLKTTLLMDFYKKAYRGIGILILLIGMSLIFFLDLIIKDTGNVENIKLIFILYVISTSFPYFMNYKTALIKADQQEYKLASYNVIFTIVIVVSQIIVLLVTKNFILYLVTNIFILLIKTIYINVIVTRMYPILRNKVTEKLPLEELISIKTNVKAMILHKIGAFSINGTDNIIISAFIGIGIVGIFSNYMMIIVAINSFIVLFFNSMSASMGNMIATSSNHKNLEVFRIINFIAFWIYGFSTICLYNLLNPTIELWLGEEFLLSKDIILVIMLNYFLTGMRVPVSTVKMAAGLYEIDKYSPLIQATVNLIFSIILVQYMGLIGVFIGTLISSLVLPIWQRPYIIYKYIFLTSSKPYFITLIKHIFIIVGIGFVTTWLLDTYFSSYTSINFIIRMAVCLFVTNIIIIILFNKSYEFKEVVRYLKLIMKRGGI